MSRKKKAKAGQGDGPGQIGAPFGAIERDPVSDLLSESQAQTETLQAVADARGPESAEWVDVQPPSGLDAGSSGPAAAESSDLGRAIEHNIRQSAAEYATRPKALPPVPAWTPAPAPFKLMQESAHWWSLQDYGAVLGVMAAIRPATVLEFGPGPSTLALIEGGATSIDTCEDAEDWAKVWDERLVKRFPGVVRQHRYSWPEGSALSIPAVNGKRFDMAFIDGPLGTPRRPDVLRYALARCTWVLLPAEEWKTRPVLRPIIEAVAKEAGRPVTFTTTGPLSGAFALIGPKA